MEQPPLYSCDCRYPWYLQGNGTCRPIWIKIPLVLFKTTVSQVRPKKIILQETKKTYLYGEFSFNLYKILGMDYLNTLNLKYGMIFLTNIVIFSDFRLTFKGMLYSVIQYYCNSTYITNKTMAPFDNNRNSTYGSIECLNRPWFYHSRWVTRLLSQIRERFL